MPIIVDTTSKDLDKQIKQMKTDLALNKQVDAKYFSKSLTGNGKRKSGFFHVDNQTFTTFMKETRRLLDTVKPKHLHAASSRLHAGNVYGTQFEKKTKPKEDKFQLFENNLTTMLPPILLHSIIDQNISKSSTPVQLTFPKFTGMYNLNAIDTTWVKVTSGTIEGKNATVYAKPVIESIDLHARERSAKSGSASTAKKESTTTGSLDVYVLFATVLDDMNKYGDMVFVNPAVNLHKDVTEDQGVVSIFPLPEATGSAFDFMALHGNLCSHIDTVIRGSNTNIPYITSHQLQLLIGDMSIPDILESQATTMVHQAEEALLTFAETFSKRTRELNQKSHKYSGLDIALENSLVTFVQHLDTLNELEDDLVSTDLLASIYETLKGNIENQRTINRIARHSLRLLLSQRLYELQEIKDSGGLYAFNPQNRIVEQAMKQDNRYSSQQKSIITTLDPLVIGQAGAGSGKSHTLIGRINYLKDQGEELGKILVLSFTNVAAINITNRFPGVRSETLANMFHTIYTATYPSQSLSQPSTVANSIRLLNPSSAYFKDAGFDEDELRSFMRNFANHLEQFDQTGYKRVNLQQELKYLSNLIEGNLDMCTHVLNAVEQTTLELEPIIIHHLLLDKSPTLNIPEGYRNLNYIITDESQDISTFEYILLIELTLHHRSQLLIIGDGSQTLYEFRNSDPRYMNALEASNVFTSHKLETNYRSKEEILMYANQFLQVIDANQYAGIQLRSSNFSAPTEDSMKEAIKISDYEIQGKSMKDYVENLTNSLSEDDDFIEWFIERVKKGEQVAIMGWTRKEVLEAGEVIQEILNTNNLGHIEITNIMSENDRPMTLLSRFARDKAGVLRSLDPSNKHYLQELEQHIDNFVEVTFKRSSSKQSTFYNDFIIRNIKEVITGHEWKAWYKDFLSGKINAHQIGSFLIQQLLRAETRKNAMDQYLRKQKEVPNYDNCPIILSTIHGTKGLEFDHTVVLFNEAKRGATSQESLRMMFVALSRAKISEYIINSHRRAPALAVTDTHAGMFQTPINSAYVRTLRAVKELNKAQQQSAVATP